MKGQRTAVRACCRAVALFVSLLLFLLYLTPFLSPPESIRHQIQYARYALQAQQAPSSIPQPNATYATRVTLDVSSPSTGAYSTFSFVCIIRAKKGGRGWCMRTFWCSSFLSSSSHSPISQPNFKPPNYRSRTLIFQRRGPCTTNNGWKIMSTTRR